MKGNIRNYKALSIYAFKRGFKRHYARFYNGETHFMHLREALKGIMPDLIMERAFPFSFFLFLCISGTLKSLISKTLTYKEFLELIK